MAVPLFDPSSIFQLDGNSSYGRFMSAIDGLDEESIPRGTFALPRVVVIGSESAGKSSLLENITKCAIFPRRGGICTKMPVRLKLGSPAPGEGDSVRIVYRDVETRVDSTDAILAYVSAKMDAMGEEIGHDELLISIRKPRALTFEFVDLPGIRAYPPPLKAATEELVSRYLSDPHTLVLCVVQATDQLTANQAIAKVLELGKQSSTILALTKADTIDATRWQTHIMDSLLGRSAELTGLGLHGCVTVVNRMQDNGGNERFALGDMMQLEREWFSGMLQACVTNADDIKSAAGNMTLGNLLKKVDDMFLSHIRRVWRPNALDMIAPLISANNAALSALGPKPAYVPPLEFARLIADRVGSLWVGTPPPFMASATGAWGSQPWATSQALALGKFRTWFERFTGVDDSFYWLEIDRIISTAFNDDAPMRSARFAAAKAAFLATAKDVYTRTLADCLPRLRATADVELARILGTDGCGTLSNLSTIVAGVLLVESVVPALESVASLELGPQALVEAPEDASKRAALEARCLQLVSARDKITRFGQ